jgi:sugar/nucleoside kinase (ribokinase family)
MAERSGILCGGCIVVDVNKTINRWPPEQEVALIAAENAQCGGPGFNMAVDLARLGATFPISIVGAIGEDAFGDLVIETCAAHGIGHAGIRRLAGARTSCTDVMIVKETGRRTFFHSQAANGLLEVGHFDLSGSSARVLHLGSPGLHRILDQVDALGRSGFAQLFEQALSLGMKTNLELVSLQREEIRSRTLPLLPLLSSVIINDLEAEALTGLTLTTDGVTDIRMASEAAAALLALGVQETVALHFPAGGVAVQAGKAPVFQPSVNVPDREIVSSNGAGDAFAAGFTLALHEGWPLASALELANASAASSLLAESTFHGVRPMKECLDLARTWGWRHSGTF